MASVEQIDAYHAKIADATKKLAGALAAIRADEAGGELSVREAADNRIAVMEAHLNQLRSLRAEYLES